MYIRLWSGGGIWIERRQYAWSFEIAKDGGEWMLWFKHLHIILTPPGWKAHGEAKASLATT
jgi:hypothetical protein